LTTVLTPWERRYGGTGLAAGLEPGGAFSALFGVKIRGPLDGIS